MNRRVESDTSQEQNFKPYPYKNKLNSTFGNNENKGAVIN